MTSTLKKLEQNKYELLIEVGHEELARYINLAESRIAQGLKLDGFRQGKAPRDLIRKEVGDQAILEEGLDIALKDSLAKTLEKENIDALKISDLNIKENSASKLLYSVKVTLFPAITLGNLQDFKVTRKDVAVDKKDIDDAMEFIRVSRAKTIPKKDPIQKGDRVELDFEVTSNGLPVEGGVSKNHPLVVGDNKFIPGFEDNLIGMKEGEEKTFSLVAPKDYFHKSVAGKDLDFKVKVLAVQEVRKPELSDDFAKSIGRFSGLKEMEENISEGILEEKKTKERQRLRLEILAGIAAKSKIELPEDMVQERLNEMVIRFDEELHQKGMELSIYLAHLNKTEDELRKDWRSEAEKQVTYALLLKKIAKDRDIKPSPEELQMETERMLQTMSMRGELDKDNINIEGLREAIAGDLTNEKVFAYLEQNYIV
jgi:trigger factor